MRSAPHALPLTPSPASPAPPALSERAPASPRVPATHRTTRRWPPEPARPRRGARRAGRRRGPSPSARDNCGVSGGAARPRRAARPADPPCEHRRVARRLARAVHHIAVGVHHIGHIGCADPEILVRRWGKSRRIAQRSRSNCPGSWSSAAGSADTHPRRAHAHSGVSSASDRTERLNARFSISRRLIRSWRSATRGWSVGAVRKPRSSTRRKSAIRRKETSRGVHPLPRSVSVPRPAETEMPIARRADQLLDDPAHHRLPR